MRESDMPRLHDDAPAGSSSEAGSLPGRRAARPVTVRSTPRGGRRRAPVRRSRAFLKVFGVTMLVLAMVTGLTMVYLYRHFSGNLTIINAEDDIVTDRPDKIDVAGAHEPLNILVMGSDSRDCAGCDLDQHTNSGQRSDTTILIHLSANRKRAYGISIPRDTMVTRPKCKTSDGGVAPAADYQFWNAAFTVGGPACTIAQTEEITGVRIDHFVVVDFNSFKSMVDAIGGVEVCIPEEIDDSEHGIFLEAGTREISGDEALSYVRVRKGIGDGSDLSRTKRQQAFIGSMANTVLSSGTLTNPVKVVRFLDAATKGLTVDDGLGDLQKLGSLGYGFKDIGLDKIQFLTIPVVADPQDPNRVVLSSQAEEVWKRVRNDRALGKELSSLSIRADSLPGQKGGTDSGEASPSADPSADPNADPSADPSASGSATPNGDRRQQEPSLDAAERERVGLCA